MLATLFDFPWEDRRKLTYWSDITTAGPASPLFVSEEHRRAQLMDCAQYFMGLWNQRVNLTEPGNDLISMLAHGESTRNMSQMEFLGNLVLLIVGGNDTTRNSITGGLLALNQNPAEYDKLRADHSLIPNMVSEIIRWQTPLAHMRRNATQDVELGGKLIKKGDKVIMVRLGQSRRRGDRERRQVHYRSSPRPPAPVIWLWHPPLRWQSSGRDAAQDRLGRNPQALGPDRGHG